MCNECYITRVLHKYSDHPSSNFKSFTKGEGIRILRNTSNGIEFHNRIKLLTEKLTVRGKNIQMIKNNESNS
jgi:hypothetical protein